MHKDVRYCWAFSNNLRLVREPHTVARRYGIDVCRVGRNVADRYSFGRLSIVRVR
jgi:hypothetical protein